jgi:hypothetical protein
LVCEPDWQAQSTADHQEIVSFSAALLVQTQLILRLTDAQSQDCSCQQTILIERGALNANRHIMFRGEPESDTDSGWVLRCTADEEFLGAPIPMASLVAAAPHFLKVVHFPRGWRAYFGDGRIDQILDPDGKGRMPGAP